MKVIDLIIKLQQCDQNLPVCLDVTKEGSPIFKIVSIDSCEEIETSTDYKCVMLSPHDYEADINDN